MAEEMIVKELEDVVVRFSGDSGDGMQLAGNMFSNISATEGNDISTFPDYPADIRAPQGTLTGVSGFQVHIGSDKVYTPVSVARYTDNYIMQISGSKAFSYAGQRIAVTAISNKLYHRAYPGLTKRYGGGTFGTVYIHRVLYALSSGTSHSAQYALAAMFKAASDGTYDFISEIKEYGRRANKMKSIFINHGFKLVYDHDLSEPVADGFYFTITYPGMDSSTLMKELIYYGISAISLKTTGSHQEGLRICTSFIKDHQYDLLDERLAAFEMNHPIA